MANIQLTRNVCARLHSPADHTILFTNPILRVLDVIRLAPPENINDLHLHYKATLSDGSGGNITVGLREDAVKGHVCDSSPCSFTSGATIKVQRMLRLPTTR